jgi:hypothetical protein
MLLCERKENQLLGVYTKTTYRNIIQQPYRYRSIGMVFCGMRYGIGIFFLYFLRYGIGSGIRFEKYQYTIPYHIYLFKYI